MKKFAVIAIILTSVFSACGKSDSARSSGNAQEAPLPKTFLKFDSNVPYRQKKLLSDDLVYLRERDHTPSLNYKAATRDSEKLDESKRKDLLPEAKRILGTPGFSGLELYQWLDDRIQYIMAENYDVSDTKNNYVPLERHTFENPDKFPPWVFEDRLSNDQSKAVVVMSNIAPGFYISGKMNGILFGIRIPGHGVVPVPSLRTGLLQVGEGLFRTQGNDAEDSLNKLLRLGTLFHEARHSDGNSERIAFSHANCPNIPEYAGVAGLPACDESLNGSYSIGAYATQVLAENCYEKGNCNRKAVNTLRAEYLDSYRRVIKGTTAEFDPTPEGKR